MDDYVHPFLCKLLEGGSVRTEIRCSGCFVIVYTCNMHLLLRQLPRVPPTSWHHMPISRLSDVRCILAVLTRRCQCCNTHSQHHEQIEKPGPMTMSLGDAIDLLNTMIRDSRPHSADEKADPSNDPDVFAEWYLECLCIKH